MRVSHHCSSSTNIAVILALPRTRVRAETRSHRERRVVGCTQRLRRIIDARSTQMRQDLRCLHEHTGEHQHCIGSPSVDLARQAPTAQRERQHAAVLTNHTPTPERTNRSAGKQRVESDQIPTLGSCPRIEVPFVLRKALDDLGEYCRCTTRTWQVMINGEPHRQCLVVCDIAGRNLAAIHTSLIVTRPRIRKSSRRACPWSKTQQAAVTLRPWHFGS